VDLEMHLKLKALVNEMHEYQAHSS